MTPTDLMPRSSFKRPSTGPIALLTMSWMRNEYGPNLLTGAAEPTEMKGSFTSAATGSRATNSIDEMERKTGTSARRGARGGPASLYRGRSGFVLARRGGWSVRDHPFPLDHRRQDPERDPRWGFPVDLHPRLRRRPSGGGAAGALLPPPLPLRD